MRTNGDNGLGIDDIVYFSLVPPSFATWLLLDCMSFIKLYFCKHTYMHTRLQAYGVCGVPSQQTPVTRNHRVMSDSSVSAGPCSLTLDETSGEKGRGEEKSERERVHVHIIGKQVVST